MVLVAHDLHGLAESCWQVTAFTNDSWLVLHSYLIMSATRWGMKQCRHHNTYYFQWLAHSDPRIGPGQTEWLVKTFLKMSKSTFTSGHSHMTSAKSWELIVLPTDRYPMRAIRLSLVLSDCMASVSFYLHPILQICAHAGCATPLIWIDFQIISWMSLVILSLSLELPLERITVLPSEEVPKYDRRSAQYSSFRYEVCFGQIQLEKRPNMTQVGRRQLIFLLFNDISISHQFWIKFLLRYIMVS